MSDRTNLTSARRPENVLLAVMLREARIRAGLSQADAAERLGVAQSYISKLEMLERKVDMTTVRDMCRAYGVDFDSFSSHWNERSRDFPAELHPRMFRSDKGKPRRDHGLMPGDGDGAAPKAEE